MSDVHYPPLASGFWLRLRLRSASATPLPERSRNPFPERSRGEGAGWVSGRVGVFGIKTVSLDSEIKKGNILLGRGNIISRKDIANNPGNYPIYSSSAKGTGEFGRYGDYMFNEELITWSVDGGGRFFFRPKHKFSVTNVSGFMRIDDDAWNKQFVYYCLDLQHQRIAFDYQQKHTPVLSGTYTSFQSSFVLNKPKSPKSSQRWIGRLSRPIVQDKNLT